MCQMYACVQTLTYIKDSCVYGRNILQNFKSQHSFIIARNTPCIAMRMRQSPLNRLTYSAHIILCGAN